MMPVPYGGRLSVAREQRNAYMNDANNLAALIV
jgi:hypothetical protein